MMEKLNFEAVDRTLKLLLKNDKPFRGVMFRLAGDFRQILPVMQIITNKESVIENTINFHIYGTILRYII